MRLILIRHGESHHTRDGRLAWVSGCTGLTERGVAQSHQLANRLAHTGELNDVTALLSSPVPRARQTAEILASRLPVPTIETDCDLCELHPGAADGLSWEEYRSRFGIFDLQADPDRPFAPGGESWSEFVSRVGATLDRLAERFAGQTVVAVSHAGFVVVSMLDRLHIPPAGERARLEPIHTSLTEWRVSAMVWRLERYNDTSHLIAPP
ncbi:MAG TPA: histidine phosphatase family protein [Chloroflexota bacterium]|nr:histidine phosphatase family protein [Chloroflexota bacterium]